MDDESQCTSQSHHENHQPNKEEDEKKIRCPHGTCTVELFELGWFQILSRHTAIILVGKAKGTTMKDTNLAVLERDAYQTET